MQTGYREIPKGSLWTGRVVSGLVVLFCVMDGGMKLFKPPEVVRATVELGYPESTIAGMGILLLACTLLYAIQRTSILGAILLTAYFGGAVASNVRAGRGWFNTLFPVLFGCMAWGGVWLRDRRLRELLG